MPATPTTFKPDYSDVVVQLMGETQDEYAALRTMHGPFGKWEHVRKALLSRLIMKHRGTEPPEGAKVWTEKVLDAAAHDDPDYLAFLRQGLADANLYHNLEELRAEQAREAGVQGHNPMR